MNRPHACFFVPHFFHLTNGDKQSFHIVGGAFVKILNDHWLRTLSTGLCIFQTKYIAMSPFRAMNICKPIAQRSWVFGQFCNRTQI